MLLVFVWTQIILVPILGLLFLGIRRERQLAEQNMREAIRALRIVGISRGRHL